MNIDKPKLRKTLYVYVALVIILIFSSKTIYNFSIPKVAVAMPESGSLTKELEVQSVAEFSETVEIYANTSGQIKDMQIKKGDYIGENTLIATFMVNKPEADASAAEMKLAVDRIENQIAALILNRTFIQDKIQALSVASADDLYVYKNSVEDAAKALEKQRTELLEAQNLTGVFSGEYEYREAIEDAERNREKQIVELEKAEAALAAIEAGRLPSSPTGAAVGGAAAADGAAASDGAASKGGAAADEEEWDTDLFDDYVYRRNIIEASVALERKNTELANAEAALADAKGNRSSAFDDYTYNNAINAAETAYDRSREDYGEALRMYDSAVMQYGDLINAGADESDISSARNSVDDAQNRITITGRALDDASVALNNAINDRGRAESAFYADSVALIADAEQRALLAKYAVDDARRVYDNAVDELDRASDIFVKNLKETRHRAVGDAKKEVETAQMLLDDAERLYNKTVANRDEAANAEERSARKILKDAENNLSDAQTALTRAEADYDMAQKAFIAQSDDIRKSLDYELKKADLDIAGANLSLRAAEVALADAAGNGLDAGVISEYSGVVISVEKSKGQYVSQGEMIATVGVNNNIFAIGFTCPAPEGRFIEIGDEASIRANGAVPGVKAVVCDIAPEGDMLKINLTCETEELTGGEFITLRFYKQTGTYETIVPNEAVVREAAGSFVWVVRSGQGAFGTEYYTIKVKVFVADIDGYNTAISKGIDFFEPVVVSYNKDLTLNGRVSRMD